MCDDACQPIHGRCCAQNPRRYYTKNEQIENLRQYKSNLEKEINGIEERIKDLSK